MFYKSWVLCFFLGVVAIMVASSGLNMFLLCVYEYVYMNVTQMTSYCLETSMRTCYSKKRTLFTGMFSLSRRFNILYDLKSRAVFWIFFCLVRWVFFVVMYLVNR